MVSDNGLHTRTQRAGGVSGTEQPSVYCIDTDGTPTFTHNVGTVIPSTYLLASTENMCAHTWIRWDLLSYHWHTFLPKV